MARGKEIAGNSGRAAGGAAAGSGCETSPPQGRDAAQLPDRSAKRPLWAYLLLALVFLGWVGFLIVCRVVGAP